LSEIRATTISDAAGTGPITLTKQSAAKSYVNISGSSLTNPASLTGINGSFNVASVLDVQTGEATVSFTSTMNNNDYSVVGTTNQSNDVSGRNSNFGAYALGTSSYTFCTCRASTAAVEDGFVVSATAHGDLA